jgi:hypothetical protein
MARRTSRGNGGGSASGGFYRLCRMLHAYFSAFAFLILLFFSITGLTLNHPDWLAGRSPPEQTTTVTIPADQLAAAMKAPSPPKALAAAVAKLTPLVGGNPSGDVADGQALLRTEGPRGVSDITVTLKTGQAEVTTRRATFVAMLNDLHKGKAAGAGWKLLIDVSAVLFIVVSLVGYVILFSLRFRLVPSLILTAVGLVLMVAAALFLVG